MEPSSPPPEKAELKPSFRKPTSDSAGRKYRRHSPVSKSDSSSSGGSPRRERSHSPHHSREDRTRAFGDQRRRDTDKELERDSSRNRSSRGYDYQKHSERYSHGNAHEYRRHDDSSRHRRHADEDNRNYQRSARSGRESRNDSRSDYVKSDKLSDRYRDNWRTGENHSKDKIEISEHKNKERETIKEYDRVDTGSKQVGLSRDYDDISEQDKRRERESRYSRKDYHRSPRNKNYQDEEYRSAQERETSITQRRESEKSSKKDAHGHENLVQKRKHSEREGEKHRENYPRDQELQTERRSLFSDRVDDGRTEVDKASDSVDKQNFAPEPKASHLEHGSAENDLSVSSGSRPANETHEKVNNETVITTTNHVGDTSDVNSAKVAALRAAELVNKNLVGFGGTGYLSTDQKKKLLWGNKKNSSTEESSSRWDLNMFSDRDRQEKFNRLMSLRLPLWLWPIVGCEGECSSGVQARCQGRKSPSEAGGAGHGSGEAVYCWPSAKRWSNSRSRSVIISVLPRSHFGSSANMYTETLRKLAFPCGRRNNFLFLGTSETVEIFSVQSLLINGRLNLPPFLFGGAYRCYISVGGLINEVAGDRKTSYIHVLQFPQDSKADAQIKLCMFQKYDCFLKHANILVIEII